MAQIATVALTDTFDSWRIRTNGVTDRINQFAVNESVLYANTVYANVALNASGTATVTGLLTASGRATVGTNLTVSGNTTLGASGKTINTTGTFNHSGLFDLTGGAVISANLDIADSSYINIGNSDDLQLYHDGTDSIISTATGDLILRTSANDEDVAIASDDGSGGLANYFLADGSTTAALLYFGGSQKLITKTDGVDITGELQTDTLDVDSTADFADNITMSGSSKTLTLNNNMLDEFTEFARALANSGTSVTLDTSDNVQQYTLTGNVTFTLPALSTYPSNSVKTITIIVKQDGTGSRTVDFSATDGVSYNNASSAPQPTTAATKVSMYTCVGVVDLSEWFVSLSFIDD